jgi:hypothetical protein
VRICFVLLFIVLSGCSSVRFSDAELQTTAAYIVPTPAIIDKPVLITLADVVGSIPLLGLFKLVRDQDARERLDRLLRSDGLDFAREADTALKAALAAANIEAGSHAAPRRDPSGFRRFADPNELPRGRPGQSFVDTHVIYGFIATVTGADYRPYIVINLQIVAADTHAIKYRKEFRYDFPSLAADSLVKIEVPENRPTWKNLKAIEADIPAVGTALKQILADVTKQVAERLRVDLPLMAAESAGESSRD